MKLDYLAISIATSILILCIGFGIGYALKLVKGIKTVADLFFAFLIGLYAVIILYSLFQTSLASINLVGLVILGIGYFYARKSQPYERPSFDLRVFAFALISFSILFYVLEMDSRHTHPNPTSVLDRDHNMLVTVSYYLNKTGQENEFHALNLLSEDYHGLSPYHYSELWLNALIAEVFSVNYDYTMAWVTPFLFYFTFFLALLCLYESARERVDFWGGLLSISFLFFFQSFIPHWLIEILDIQFLNNLRQDYFFHKTHYLRMAPYLIWISTFLILWLKDQKLLAYLALIFMSIVQFTSLPAVFGFIGIWTSYHGLLKKKKLERTVLFWLVVISVTYLFHKNLLSNKELSREGSSVSDLVNQIFSTGDYLAARVNILIKEVIRSIFKYHILWFVVLLGFVKSKYKASISEPVKILFGICFIGLLSHALLMEILNSQQLFQVVASTWVPIFFFLVLILSLNYKSSFKKFIVPIFVFFLVVGINNRYQRLYPKPHEPSILESDYLVNIDQFLNGESKPNPIGASFRNTYPDPYHSYVTIYTLGNYLSKLRNGACTISLSDLNIPRYKNAISQSRSENGYKLGWLYRTAEELKSKGDFISHEETQLRLLKEGKFEYAIFESGYEIPEKIKEMIQQVYTDEDTGEMFVIFKRV